MRLLLLSSSRVNGCRYLDYAKPQIQAFLGKGIQRVLFVPFAWISRTWDQYIEQVEEVFSPLGLQTTGLHRCPDPIAAVRNAQAIAVGGGNTFYLLAQLRNRKLLAEIYSQVQAGVPYIGWSAGINVACPSIMTTNDMPVCDPHGLDALGLLPFQINPHFLDIHPPGFHGETREQRISEFLLLNQDQSVLGLREGTYLRREGKELLLQGINGAKLFRYAEPAQELVPGSDCSFLLAKD